VVTDDKERAEQHASECGRVVIEEFLDGPEVSVFALTDGTEVLPLLPAQDFKRAFDQNEGPNTAEWGAYTPLGWAPDDLAEQTVEKVIKPTVSELSRREAPYVGVVYAGLCLTNEGPKVIEFNARFGDPECQVVLDRLETPLGLLLQSAAIGSLSTAPTLSWRPGAAVAVVIAAEGYPADPVKGDRIDGIEQATRVPGAYVLHAGTQQQNEGLVTNGGRLLNVIGTGPDVATARAIAYDATRLIKIRGSHYRSDIAGGQI